MKHTMYINNQLCILDVEVGGALKKRLSDAVAKEAFVSLINGENPGLERAVVSLSEGFFFEIKSDNEIYGIIGFRDSEQEEVRHDVMYIVVRMFEISEYRRLEAKLEKVGKVDPKVKYIN